MSEQPSSNEIRTKRTTSRQRKRSNNISSAIAETIPEVPSKLAKKFRRKDAQPVVHEDPRQELRRLVAMHKNWTQTAKAWNQSIHDITLRTGEVVKCTKPEYLRADMARTVEALQGEAKSLETAMLVQLRRIPIYDTFLKHVYGIGPVVAAYLCAMIRPERCVKVSRLWRYCGNACDPKTGKREIRSGAPKYLPDGSVGDGTGSYNDELKMRIYQGMVAMRKNSFKVSEERPFGTINKYLTRWAFASYSRRTTGREKGADHAGRRKATDLFLEDLYVIWRTLEGLPVWPDLYSVRRGFFHGGQPCVNEGRVLTLEEALAVVGDFRAHAATEPVKWKEESESDDGVTSE